MTLAFGNDARPVFDHLDRMTDERGLFEHARYDEPRPEHGYCLDDAARGLVVVSRQPPTAQLHRLGRCYLGFVLAAVQPDGTCHNRMALDGAWTDTPSVGDWWGRAVWGLGVAAVDAATPGARARALVGFRVAAQQRSTDSRATSFAAIGAARVLRAYPDDGAARALLVDCLAALAGPPETGPWPWPEPRLRYANAAVTEALIVSGDVLGEPALRDRGLALLGFLLDVETRDGHLSVTPVGGRGPEDTGPAFDQQPIEVAALAEACTAAYLVTTAPRWRDGVALAWRWFLGDNDSATPMFDARTGGGFDGLERTGRNLNQGAESTLAVLATAQRAQLVCALP